MTQTHKTLGLSILIFLYSLTSYSVEIEVIGHNNEVLLQSTISKELPSSVGEITVEVFDEFQVPYEGSIYGISKIYELDQYLDIISNVEMKAYGWCFSLDGVTVETLTDETLVESPDAIIRWYYAYAHYDSGEWIAQCVPSQKIN